MHTIKFITIVFIITALAACQNKKAVESTEVKTEIVNGIATSTFKVWGNCGMCKETIEASLKMDGITNSDWDTETKMIHVSYDTIKVTLDRIQKNIAMVGYDNIKYKGNDSAYKNLAECCQYERK